MLNDFSFGQLDPYVFSRAFDPKSPISSGARHLSALATRLSFSLMFGLLALPDSVWEQAKALLSASAIWSLCLVLGAWLLATVIGGPIGLAIDGLIVAYGLYELWPVIKGIAGDLWDWLLISYYANNEKDLKLAGKHFADAIGVGGLAVLESILLHRVFRGVSKTMVDHIPVPEWLNRRSREVENYRKRKTEETESRKRRTELERKVHSAAGHVLGPAGRGVKDFPYGVAIGTGLVVLATGATLAIALSGGRRER